MRVLVVGSGAREHAIVWKFLQSPRVKEVYVAPGNAGTAQIAHNLDISHSDIPALIQATKQYAIDFTFVGPETPLALGIVDEFSKHGMPVFGPTRNAARIESSKVFSKNLMNKYGIPTASSRNFTQIDQAVSYVMTQNCPIVIKADGLAAGKGVIIAHNTQEAIDALKALLLEKELGQAGTNVLVEEYMEGREMSMFVFSDGHSLSAPVCACDYKRVFDNNQGPNTGGMGSFSPPDFSSVQLEERSMRDVMRPTIKALREEESLFAGVLYGGLMINNEAPRTVEFNCRLGDPETQVIIPRLKTDLVEIALAVIEKRLDKFNIEWSADACVGVVMASHGYPGKFSMGVPIYGLNDVDNDVMVFHASTKSDGTGRIVTAGGRVLTVVASAPTLTLAREKVYSNVKRIRFDKAHYRTDIAKF